MNNDTVFGVIMTVAFCFFIATVGSCSYYSTKDHNQCVIAAASADVAELCTKQ